MKAYAIISLYLYVCLGAILLFKIAVLRAEGVQYAAFGMAAVKALILGKFMLLGHALKVGGRTRDDRPLIYPVVRKSLSFLALLAVLDIIEEVLAGWVQGRPILNTISEIAGGTGLQILATCLLFFLILLPYFAFREADERLGEHNLSRLIFGGRRQ